MKEGETRPSTRQVVIVAYRPKPGKLEELLQLTREHLPILRAEGLATERAAIAGQSADGTVVEVFEWEAGGVERAHTNARVGALWGRYAEACEIVTLKTLAEAGDMFASFAPVDL